MRKLSIISFVLISLVSCQNDFSMVESTYSNVKLRTSNFTVRFQDGTSQTFIMSNYVDKSYDINKAELTFISDPNCPISVEACKKVFTKVSGYSELNSTYSTPCAKK